MEEHYFGVIRPVVSEYMKEVDEELWKLGIPAKTKHNEVAPAQHELAPIFTTTNAAVDGNLLTMEVMRRVAEKHGLICLLHEKPFAGVNGSGKHNNWSLSTPTMNLLDPGDQTDGESAVPGLPRGGHQSGRRVPGSAAGCSRFPRAMTTGWAPTKRPLPSSRCSSAMSWVR